MSARNNSRKEIVQQLRASYQEAFDQWALATTRLQLLIRSAAGKDAVNEARLRVAAAHAAYRESRDLLASTLVSHQSTETPQLLRIVPTQTMRPAARQ